MPRGKPWTPQEEKQLRELIQAGKSLDSIASKLGRTHGAVWMKAQRLGLEVVVSNTLTTTTTSLKIPKELPSVEEALKILAAALKAAAAPGLDRVEIQRLQAVATLARTHKELFADYVD
jgi:hypothetical protein